MRAFIPTLLFSVFIGCSSKPAEPAPVSPAAMNEFLAANKLDYPNSEIVPAMKKCFVAGTPAAEFEAVFAKANVRGVPRDPQYKDGVEYTFWCGGRDPSDEGDGWVTVVVAGQPPAVESAEFNCFIK